MCKNGSSFRSRDSVARRGLIVANVTCAIVGPTREVAVTIDGGGRGCKEEV